MPTPHYLIVHIPGRGQLTLSLPGGFERAFRYGRLPDDSEVWHAAGGVWLPILRHPAIVKLREAALSEAYDYEFEFALSEPVERIEPVPVQVALPEPGPAPVPIEPEVPVESENPALLPLIAVGEWQHHLAEFSRLVARSSAQEQRRQSGRNSGGVKRRESAVFFAGVAAPVEDPLDTPPRGLARFRTQVLAGALVLLVAMGIGGWLWYRAPNGVSASLTTGELTARERDSLALLTAGSNVQIAEPSLMAVLEAALESDLRIAEAATWQPAIDFASEDQVARSSRKLEAVRNSIGLYRLAAWRSVDSLDRETDPRLEPFVEAERVDVVLGIMSAAVVFLDSMTGHFSVSGDLLVFDRAQDAEQFSAIARIADSLLRAPVELDSFPAVRAPRRVVARLLATLPSAAFATPSQP